MGAVAGEDAWHYNSPRIRQIDDYHASAMAPGIQPATLNIRASLEASTINDLARGFARRELWTACDVRKGQRLVQRRARIHQLVLANRTTLETWKIGHKSTTSLAVAWNDSNIVQRPGTR
jgi:hypothetical protein